MKKFILSAAVCVGLATQSYSQIVSSNSPIDTTVTQILDQLKDLTNWDVAVYGIADTTTHGWGEGVGLIYNITPNFAPVVRLDCLNASGHPTVWMPSGTMQFQLPVTISSKLQVSPFLFAGVASPIAGQGLANHNVVTISGVGAYIKLSKKFKVGGDYELWSGNKQIRFGLGWGF